MEDFSRPLPPPPYLIQVIWEEEKRQENTCGETDIYIADWYTKREDHIIAKLMKYHWI